jgi:hypothetical protein
VDEELAEASVCRRYGRRSIKYQLTKDIDELEFEGTPTNESLVDDRLCSWQWLITPSYRETLRWKYFVHHH